MSFLTSICWKGLLRVFLHSDGVLTRGMAIAWLYRQVPRWCFFPSALTMPCLPHCLPCCACALCAAHGFLVCGTFCSANLQLARSCIYPASDTDTVPGTGSDPTWHGKG